MAQKEKELKSRERTEIKFSIPKFSSMNFKEKMRLVGWSLAVILVVVFLFVGMQRFEEKKAGLPSAASKFPTTATGELKVDSQQDVKKATVSVGNDIEGLIGSLRELDTSLK